VLHPGAFFPPFAPPWPAPGTPFHLLSVGRIQSDKRLDLALDAWAAARARVGQARSAAWRFTLLGGFDTHHADALATRRALAARIAAEGWSDSVRLVLEASPAELSAAFAAAHAQIHPMPGEHFGIAPVEGMAHGRPVLAVAGAGPDETILDGVTGALRPVDADALGEVLARWGTEPDALRPLGAAARERAREFSRERFASAWTAWVGGTQPDVSPYAPAAG
jgi:glycosyltransferase involved in cell wall biosynthesis